MYFYALNQAMIKLISPSDWPEYELIDSGNTDKLERFGKHIIQRPEPQAVWNRTLSDSEWKSAAEAVFKKEKGNPEKGEWVLKKGMPEQWHINYQYKEMKIRMRLGLTSFRHIGIFPEQSDNWNYIFNNLSRIKAGAPKVLNLFAYTGGASLAAKSAGADVVHVDSVKPVVSWARENMEESNLENIRWVVEDAMKFVKREVKRGNKYEAILLDPPAYGRGPDGEKWQLEDQINEMLELCSQLLSGHQRLLLLNLYSMGYSPLILENLVKSNFNNIHNLESGELFVPDKFGKRLPLGVFLRFHD